MCKFERWTLMLFEKIWQCISQWMPLLPIHLKMNLEVYCNNHVCLFANLSFPRAHVKTYAGAFKSTKSLKKNYRYLFMSWAEHLQLRSWPNWYKTSVEWRDRFDNVKFKKNKSSEIYSFYGLKGTVIVLWWGSSNHIMNDYK